jgi:hypothetical protein
MVLPGVATQAVYRLRGTEVTDEWQGKTFDWSNPDRKKITGCTFQPLVGDEFNEGRDAIVTRWEWFGPPNADVLSTDRIEFEGIAYDVDGSVGAPKGLGLDHKHAVCRRVDG